MRSSPDTPVRVLLVEDNPADARLVRELLRDMEGPGLDLQLVSRLGLALEKLTSATIDIVLLDLALPDSRGVETLRRLRQHAPAIPIIVLTDVHDEALAVQVLRAGSQDCLAKDHADRHTLLRAVRHALERSHAQRTECGQCHVAVAPHVEREVLYKTLGDVATDFVWSCRPDGTIDYVNRRWQEYTGLSLEQLTVEQWESLNHPDDLPNLRALWQAAMQTGQPFETEFRYRGKDDQYRWFWGRATPLREPDGRIAKWIGTATDITRRKQAEEQILNAQCQLEQRVRQRTEELRASEDRYRRILDTAQEGVWVLDAAGKTTYVNRRMAEMLGCSTDEVLGKSLFDFMDERARVDAQVHFALRKHGMREQRDFCFRHKDGSELWTICSTNSLQGSGDEPAGVLCMVTDITERKHADEALRETSQRLKFHVENSPLAVVEWDLDFRITRWTDEARRIFGWSEAEVLGRRIDELGWIYEDDWENVRQVADRMLDGSCPRSVCASRCRRKDGLVIHCEWYNSALLDLSGKLVSVLSLMLEVTERKRAEEELLKAKQAAEDATAAKSVFLATMSHEIRTPLNGVVGMVDLLLSTQLDDRQRRYAQIIKASANALVSLINDILDFSKIEANRMDLEDVSFDLFGMVEDLVETFVQRAAQKRLELGCHLHAQLPEGVTGDAAKLRQVLSNLIGNALKFTEQGHVLVEGVLESEAPDRVIVRFTVSDTGPGITTEHVDKLFQPFYQVDASTTRKYGGSGLGLAISKKLVEMMGGQITVHSEPAKGSSFSFTVPLRKQPESKGLPLLARVPAYLRGTRVLIVDDSPVSRRLLQGQLSDWGLSVQAIADSRQAMELLHEAAALGKPFKLAILADDLPDISGLELAKTIKGSDSLAQTALVLLISMEQNPDANQLRDIGVAGSMIWPVRASRLLEVITQVLPAEEPERKSTATDDHPQPGGRPRRTRILLAEDNEINQVVAAEILMRAGYQCQVVGSGKQAVDAIMQSQYDLLLMDCQMPQMDGFEATQVIRQQEQAARQANKPAPHLPIIALTAEAVKGDRERCLEAGMDAYVPKPIDANRLIATIESFLSSAPPPPVTPVLPSVPVQSRDMAPPVDATALLARCTGNRALAQKVLQKFSTDAIKHLQELKACLVKNDLDRLSRIAHRFKGAAANLSANPVSQIASELEQAGRTREADRAAELLRRLDVELHRCLACIPRAVAELGQPRQDSPTEA